MTSPSCIAAPARSRLRLQPNLAALVFALVAVAPALAGPVFNGGPVLSNPQDVYFIYYGDNWTSSEKTLTQQLVTDLSGSSYFAINSTYGAATTSLTFKGSVDVTSSSASWLGSTLEARTSNGYAGISTMLGIVNTAISAGFGTDPNGIYYVLTSDDVKVNGFNNIAVNFCGWHSSSNWGTNSLGTQFGFIGEPSHVSLGGYTCEVPTQSPGLGDFGVDAMDSVIAHELSETVTDPTGTAWWDSVNVSTTRGYENADMCAWQFGTTQTVNGGLANLTINNHDYLLQENWINTGNGTGRCAMSYGQSTPPPVVSEPTSLALIGIALAGLTALRRRKP